VATKSLRVLCRYQADLLVIIALGRVMCRVSA